MNKFIPFGILGTDENDNFVYLPITILKESVVAELVRPVEEQGRIAKQPTPDEDRISKEQVKDLSLEGILKKNKSDKIEL